MVLTFNYDSLDLTLTNLCCFKPCSMWSVLIAESGSCYVLGTPLLKVLKRRLACNKISINLGINLECRPAASEINVPF